MSSALRSGSQYKMEEKNKTMKNTDTKTDTSKLWTGNLTMECFCFCSGKQNKTIKSYLS